MQPPRREVTKNGCEEEFNKISASRFSSHLRAFAVAFFLIWLPAAAAQEVRGVSLAHLHRTGFGYGSEECRKQLAEIRSLGANWIAINDFAYMGDVHSPEVRFGGDRSMTRDDLVQVIRDAHALGLKVLVKPHIWSRQFWNESKWHGDIKMDSEAEWDQWFANYTQYVLFNASIAAETGAEALCVGVEYEGTVHQEARWRTLIAEVRAVYGGKLTYAAAFLEWKKIDWWDALDCIGIDAYYPLTENLLADEDELRAGWARVYAELEPFARRVNKPICFTEIGYSPSSHAGKEPWSYEIKFPADPAYQARLYKVAMEEAAKRDFVVGLFIWKWFTSDHFRRVEHPDPFAMQDNQLVRQFLRDVWSGER